MMNLLYTLLLSLFVFSCSEKENPVDSDDVKPEFQLKGTISGFVTDQEENPLSGVAVTLDSAGYDTQSDQEGEYTIPDVPKGNYKMTFTKTGYADTTIRGVTILEDQELVFKNVAMRATGALDSWGFVKGKVLSSKDSSGIKGILVSIDKVGLTATSGEDGSFLIPQVNPGTYTISISSELYYKDSIPSVKVSSQDTSNAGKVYLKKKTNLELKGTLEGTLDYDYPDKSGIVINATPITEGETHSSATDDEGNFSFKDIPVGEYIIRAVGSHTSSPDTVEVKDGVVAKSTLKDLKVDASKVEHDVYGSLTGKLENIVKITATIEGDGLTEALVTELSWIEESSQFTGNVYLPKEGKSWTATVKVTTTGDCIYEEGCVSGIATLDFDNKTGDIAFPEFDVWNAKPRIISHNCDRLHAQKESNLFCELKEYHIFPKLTLEKVFQTCPNRQEEGLKVEIKPCNEIIVKLIDSEGNQDTTSTIIFISDHSGPGLIDQRDGQFYETIYLNGQHWMAQNLNYDIFTEMDSTSCFYKTDLTLPNCNQTCIDNENDKCHELGRLYTQRTALRLLNVDFDTYETDYENEIKKLGNHIQGLCPKGWRIPSKADISNINQALIEKRAEMEEFFLGELRTSLLNEETISDSTKQVLSSEEWVNLRNIFDIIKNHSVEISYLQAYRSWLINSSDDIPFYFGFGYTGKNGWSLENGIPNANLLGTNLFPTAGGYYFSSQGEVSQQWSGAEPKGFFWTTNGLMTITGTYNSERNKHITHDVVEELSTSDDPNYFQDYHFVGYPIRCVQE